MISVQLTQTKAAARDRGDGQGTHGRAHARKRKTTTVSDTPTQQSSLVKIRVESANQEAHMTKLKFGVAHTRATCAP